MFSGAKISVVIPCYNGGRFLGETLTSVMHQTYPAYEVLVIDDGSTDDSAAIAESYGPPVRVIRQPNRGESIARNRGIEEARGEWVAFLDADDLWSPTKLQQQLERRDGNYVASCTGAHVWQCDSNEKMPDWIPEQGCFSPDKILGGGTPCLISTVIVRAGLPCRFPTWTRYAEDAIYLLDLVRLGPIEVLGSRLASYRVHSDSQSRSLPDIQIRWHRSMDRWIVDHSQISDAKELERVRTLALAPILSAEEKAYRKRDWDQFELLNGYLASRDDLPDIGQPRRTRRYPKWCYSTNDFLRIALRTTWKRAGLEHA